MMRPTAVSRSVWPTISRFTAPVVAPSAMRMPISCVRWFTKYEMNA